MAPIAQLAISVLIASSPITGSTAARAQCRLDQAASRVVVRITPAASLILEDGSEVVLIGALPPQAPPDADPAQPWPHAQTTQRALDALLTGKTVELATAGRKLDRWGRTRAHVFITHNGERIWLQGHLIAQGLARAYGLPGHAHCLRELAASEASARTARSGLWADGVFQDRAPGDLRARDAYRDTFQTVEGTVIRIAKVRGERHLVFGPDWQRDFTAGAVRLEQERRTIDARWLDSLPGKTVRVRGWVERRRGPFMALHDAAQIEILDAATVGAGPAGPAPDGTPDDQPAAPPSDGPADPIPAATAR